MKNVLTIHEQDIVPDAPDIDTAGFRKREATRAVVLDNDGKIALLRVGLYDYHKLPGGGIDEGEDIPTAIERELLEEIGCKAEVTGEVGKIVEYRNQFELVQTSYCFKAAQVGEKGKPDFTEKELREQFSIVWADDIDGAISLLEQDEPTNYEGKFIKIRDLALLKAVRN
ncbi:NUDIX domain-containing protein [Patescibacteria group bacterium]|nr:MAG: NUDIX domain-containing protein [Patescibacteria group bacterium]